ncbi:hypothetical protein PA25_13340 [Pseudoalteromonas sp. A25]|nr:hypothetical protein PA25_13340 [Pseudoalteromonas sp. A25]
MISTYVMNAHSQSASKLSKLINIDKQMAILSAKMEKRLLRERDLSASRSGNSPAKEPMINNISVLETVVSSVASTVEVSAALDITEALK